MPIPLGGARKQRTYTHACISFSAQCHELDALHHSWGQTTCDSKNQKVEPLVGMTLFSPREEVMPVVVFQKEASLRWYSLQNLFLSRSTYAVFHADDVVFPAKSDTGFFRVDWLYSRTCGSYSFVRSIGSKTSCVSARLTIPQHSPSISQGVCGQAVFRNVGRVYLSGFFHWINKGCRSGQDGQDGGASTAEAGVGGKILQGESPQGLYSPSGSKPAELTWLYASMLP